MRIKELAELTGTTVRTIRYYHQIDLLPVPAVRHGRRDYELGHVARLVRIRWLTQAGVPLSKIAGILRPDNPSPGSSGTTRDSVLADLRATVTTLDEQIVQLQAQRERISRLMASVERHDHLSPVPPAVGRFYDDMERQAGSEAVRRQIRRERDFMELAFYRGDMPPEAQLVYEGFTATRLAESLALFGQLADRSAVVATLSEAEIEQIAAAAVARVRRHLGDDLRRAVGTIDLEVARRAADLYVRLADPADRRLGRAIGDAMLALIEEAQS